MPKRKKVKSSKHKRYYQTMIGDDHSGIRKGKYGHMRYDSRRK